MVNLIDLKSGAAAFSLAAIGLFASGASAPAMACSAEATYIGSICSFAGNYCPENYMKAEGQTLQVTDNPALYAVIGTAFGGDGRTTFALPDLRGRTPVGLGTAFRTTVTMGTRRGAEQTTLAADQLTAHSHQAQLASGGPQQVVAVNVSQTTADVATPGAGDYLAVPAYESFVPAASAGQTVQLAGGSSEAVITGPLQVQETGGNAAVNLLTPYQVATYCVRTTGLFPPRN